MGRATVATQADVTTAICRTSFHAHSPAFSWPHDTVTETLNVAAANTQYITGYDTALADASYVHIMARAANGYGTEVTTVATWITDLDAIEDGNAGTLETEVIAYGLGNNRRILFGHDAGGFLSVGVNNADVAGEMLLVITTLPVAE